MNAPVVRDRAWHRRRSIAANLGRVLGELLLGAAAERVVQTELAVTLRFYGWRCVPPEKRSGTTKGGH